VSANPAGGGNRGRAAAEGFEIIQGLLEPDRSLPYAPFLDLLRSLMGASSRGGTAVLGSAAPELSDRFPKRQLPVSRPPRRART
jgi:hypothetical protein